MKAVAVLALVLAAALGGAQGACRGQARFDAMMCDSHMCTQCVLEWCMQTCQKVQEDFPDCRCASWPSARTTYSGGNFQSKGKYGDVGDYSK
eukprot:CAMPEP_0204608708 /NCGR_PEP_ID=MMETSP0661-20131031/60477_1 /ASSEMBLY_ACC=CAM_ASM_000606 /TAXON_ID=109239 /ORGANISM="Alexandrium margalefi, Strain AMGDE01CS-322" /LENGTH=91 /DNA_ID=CAMNT_0051620263 /DNA_START=41 /DNA_END=316 /DNA_ORIENTATION=+